MREYAIENPNTGKEYLILFRNNDEIPYDVYEVPEDTIHGRYIMIGVTGLEEQCGVDVARTLIDIAYERAD